MNVDGYEVKKSNREAKLAQRKGRPVVTGALPYIYREPSRKARDRRIARLVKEARD